MPRADHPPPRRRRVALLVETSLGSGREILRGIAKFAHQTDGWQLFHVPRGLAEEPPSWLNEWRGDGIIARVQDATVAQAVLRRRLPAVDVLGVVENSGIPLVHVNDRAVAAELARYYQERGFRRFGYYGISRENWSEKRRDAFRDEVGCAPADFYSLESPRSDAEGSPDQIAELRRWVRTIPKPAGIMVCSDQRALALLEACRSEGVAVPEELAVVGVDNDVPLCEIATPPLSSVRAGHYRVGFEAAALLHELMAGRPAPQHQILVPPTGIVVRQSSSARAIEDAVVARGIRFVAEHLGEKLTIERVAAAAGVSRTLFQRRFRASQEGTIHEFILSQRLKRAESLLRNSALTLAEIAQRAGFRHQEYMGAVFREKWGVTPASIRRGVTPVESAVEPAPDHR
ncbi:DNA-binding transcriptional regulator [soil metagenome]